MRKLFESANAGPAPSFSRAGSKLSTHRRLAHHLSEKCSVAHTQSRAPLGFAAISATATIVGRNEPSLARHGWAGKVKRRSLSNYASRGALYRDASKRGTPTQFLPDEQLMALLAKFFTKLSTASGDSLEGPLHAPCTPLARPSTCRATLSMPTGQAKVTGRLPVTRAKNANPHGRTRSLHGAFD